VAFEFFLIPLDQLPNHRRVRIAEPHREVYMDALLKLESKFLCFISLV